MRLRAEAFAKVNLALHVRPSRGEFHPIRSIMQSVSVSDLLTLSFADEDRMAGLVEAPAHDLAWRAVARVRDAVTADRPDRWRPVALDVAKRIPVMAGLGGGSADAAAALVAATKLFGGDPDFPSSVAQDLGSDVPFCLTGGTAVVTGRGERVQPIPPIAGYALGIVVPPVELATAEVFATWDRMGEPLGPTVAPSSLPPQLRELAPLRNDLYPAAIRLRPQLDEWRAELVAVWDRQVAMTGSGAGLFAFFPSEGEAEDAVKLAPPGARAIQVAVPVQRGVSIAMESTEA